MLHILLKSLTQRKDVMNRRQPYEDFTCPNCGAEYKLVRMPAAADSHDPPLHCKNCNQEFASTDGATILKYFLVGRRRRSRPAVLTATTWRGAPQL
jgi:predicted RNA-binding Zn-ribbon protein involved in translation (DUF1610 family)